MKNTANNNFSISKLSETHQRPLFCCGISSLDNYLYKQAGQDSRKSTAITYILNDDTVNKIAGYYTLSSTVVELNELPEKLSRKLPYYPLLPATLIGRLAVDVNYQKQGFGTILLLDALYRIQQASQDIASVAVIVDATDDNAIRFYKKYGFSSLLSHTNKLFLSINVIDTIINL